MVAEDLLGGKRKQGVLATEGEFEPSMAWEILETKGKSRITSGWSLDAITTKTRGGFGIAKDIYKTENIEVDLGAYVTEEYDELLKGELDPELGVGLSISF